MVNSQRPLSFHHVNDMKNIWCFVVFHCDYGTPSFLGMLEPTTHSSPTAHLSLALLSVLNMKFDSSLCLIGLLCSSFVSINAATHGRTMFAPLGDESRPHVRLGNLLATRTLGFKFRIYFSKSSNNPASSEYILTPTDYVSL